MNSSFRPLLVIGAVVLAMVGFSLFRKADDGPGTTDAAPWRKDLHAALDDARGAGKPVLAYFTASWCPPCKQMKAQTWPNIEVAAALDGLYVPVKVDVDAASDVAREYGVSSIPTTMILDPSGKPLQTRVGFVSPDEMVRWLKAGAPPQASAAGE